jgi:hypothetical protein
MTAHWLNAASAGDDYQPAIFLPRAVIYSTIAGSALFRCANFLFAGANGKSRVSARAQHKGNAP